MKVRMRYQMSGGRHDGQPWPALNGTIDVPEWEARDLIRAEIAVPADSASKEVAGELAEQPTPGHPSKIDVRPPSQIEGEELAAQAAAEQGDPAAVAESSEPSGELPSLARDVAGLDEAGGDGNAAQDAAESSSVAGSPGPSAPKAAWIAYAISQGADEDTTAAMTKADLMSRYGGRL